MPGNSMIGRLKTIKRKIVPHLTNAPGWRTKRKIVVIESDDWGSIRSSSRASLEVFKKQGYSIDNCHYMRYDSLASEEDLELFFDLLLSQKSHEGRYPLVTANVLTANPDFDRIKADKFSEYYFEDIVETFKKYPQHSKCQSLWRKAIDENIFYAQCHGREHLNISRWMADLQQGNQETHLAFDHKMFGISAHISKKRRGSYLAAFDLGDKAFKVERAAIILDALNRFEQYFGYSSKSFIAPNYVWDATIETALKKGGVQYLQGSRVQQLSTTFGLTRKTRAHYLGETNKHKQKYLLRNCFFEPSSKPEKDWVNSCLREIKTAFLWRKPAIISMHRVNFVGFLDVKNRDQNLLHFKHLLEKIIQIWPEVEFMSSDQLGELIAYK